MIEFLSVTKVSVKGSSTGTETPALLNIAKIVSIEYADIPGRKLEGCSILLTDGTRLFVRETSAELFATGVEHVLGLGI